MITQRTPEAAKPLTRMLCCLGGMRSDMIDELPEERGAFINTAATMLGVGLLATASMTFALESTRVVPSWGVAAVAGLCWGAIIVVIDRIIITSMARHPKGGWRNVVGASANFALRVTMAVVIGAVVSMPLTIKIYEREILAQVQVDIAQKRIDGEKKLDVDFAEIPGLEERVTDLQDDLAAADTYNPEANPAYITAKADAQATASACEEASAAAAGEAKGTSGTGRGGYGDEWQRLKAIAEAKCQAAAAARTRLDEVAATTKEAHDTTVDAARQQIQGELDRAKETLATLRKDRDAADAKLNGAINAADGLAARIQALDNLAIQYPGVWWARAGLMAALILVDVIPVLSRFLRTISAADVPTALEAKRNQARIGYEDIYEAGRLQTVKAQGAIQEMAARDWATRQAEAETAINARKVEMEKQIELERLAAWAEAERTKNAQDAAAHIRPGNTAGATASPANPTGYARRQWPKPAWRIPTWIRDRM
ncbi:MAG: DUF4407 domain-containing protein [Bifidobacteriaceae bacterium]|nr:DUF4407 domain-containing protein [Bifidobacteriaceae bacterium]